LVMSLSIFVIVYWIAIATVSAQITFISGYNKNITSWQFSQSSGQLTYLGSSMGPTNPSWMTWTQNLQFMYAATDLVNPGVVVAYRIQQGSLIYINTVLAGGGNPCYISIHRSQKWLFAANYVTGTISVFPLDSTTGAIGTHVYSEKHGEWAHMVVNDKSGKFVFAAYKGSDYIAQFIFDEERGTLTPNVSFVRTGPGSGPRHFVFHPSEKWFFILTETTSTVVTCKYDSVAGQITPISSISTIPADFTGPNTGAEILITPDGKYVYSSNRGHNSIAIFSFTESTGILTLVGWEQGGGSIVTPRGVSLYPSGTHLLVASQDTDSITTFAINSDGTLHKIEHIEDLPPQPSFIGILSSN